LRTMDRSLVASRIRRTDLLETEQDLQDAKHWRCPCARRRLRWHCSRSRRPEKTSGMARTSTSCMTGSGWNRLDHLLWISGWLERKSDETGLGVEQVMATRRWEEKRMRPRAGRHQTKVPQAMTSRLTFSRYCVAAHELYFSVIPIPLVYPPSLP
jgi:hypothetical protein